MQATWIKTRFSVKDEDNPEDLLKTKSEEIRPRIECQFCILVCFVNLEYITK